MTIKQIAEDVAKAIRWTHDHAQDYRGDPDRIIVMGHSAGAQLAALVCTDDRYLKAEGLTLSPIKACVPVDGDSYDVPLQIQTVEEEREASYTLTFGDPKMRKPLPTMTLVAKGKRAASYRVKFGDEPTQRELSAVTHVAQGKRHSALPDPPRCGPPGNEGPVSPAGPGAPNGRHFGQGVSCRGQEPHHDQCRLGAVRRQSDAGNVCLHGRRA